MAGSVTCKWRKLVAVAWQGGRCYGCGKEYKEEDDKYGQWQFAHIVPLKNSIDRKNRWSGYWREQQPLTREWKEWQSTVLLVCGFKCNNRIEAKPLTIAPIDIDHKDDFEMSAWRQYVMDFDVIRL